MSQYLQPFFALRQYAKEADTMKRFGLIGNPIGHSQSPSLFREAYPGSEMTYDLIETETFSEAFDIFLQKYDAINVTAPFKEEAFTAADCADEPVGQTGAANLLKKENGVIKAYNTDSVAVQVILKRLCDKGALVPEKDSILIVGCGGAGKAAAWASSLSGFHTVVANRNLAKAAEFCKKIENTEAISLQEAEKEILRCKAVIYTLPVAVPDINASTLEGKIVLEANYRNPAFASAEKSGTFTYISGNEWLIEQARAGFEIMTEITVSFL